MRGTSAAAVACVACALVPGASCRLQKTVSKGLSLLPGARGRIKQPSAPGSLILVRNGLPDWPLPEDNFIGWADPDLSEEGQMQVRSAARLLVESGHTVDAVFTSMAKRSIRTVWIILHELERIYLPVSKTWRLSAQRYGALTGMSIAEARRVYGEEIVAKWKTGLDERPPAARLGRTDAQYEASKERHFPHLGEELDLLEAESKADALMRCEPVWQVQSPPPAPAPWCPCLLMGGAHVCTPPARTEAGRKFAESWTRARTFSW